MNSPKSAPAVMSALLLAATAAGKTPPPTEKTLPSPESPESPESSELLKEEDKLGNFLRRALKIENVICGKESCAVTTKARSESYPYDASDCLSTTSGHDSLGIELNGNTFWSQYPTRLNVIVPTDQENNECIIVRTEFEPRYNAHYSIEHLQGEASRECRRVLSEGQQWLRTVMAAHRNYLTQRKPR